MEQNNSNLVELQLDSLESDFNRRFANFQTFDDSLCNEGIEIARKLALENNFRFYDMEGAMDSSSTPTVILRDSLNFKILGGYDKNWSFKYCYNQATLRFFQDQKGFNAFDYIRTKYDSLFELGLTHEKPTFMNGNPEKTVMAYFYCNMNLQNAEPGLIKVHIKIDSLGKPEITLINPTGHELDSTTYELFRNMPTWNPGHSENNNPYRGMEYTFPFRYDESKVEEYCI